MVTALSVAALIAASGLTANVALNYNDTNKAEQSYASYQRAINKAGLSDLSVDDVIDDLYRQGKISASKYEKSIKTAQKMANYVSEGSSLASIAQTFSGNNKELKELYTLLENNIPELSYTKFKKGETTVDDIRKGIYSAVPNIVGVAAPKYYDTNFEGYQRPIDEVKYWTGQELADLHNIDYNVNNYYDAIKQGADAAVAYQNFTNEQDKIRTGTQDTINKVAYLDALRANKAKSVIKGATLGAQMANDLLTNQSAYNQFAQDQAGYVNNSFAAMQEPLQNQASAELNARQYYDRLAQTLGKDIETLYWNDTNRYGADINANANFYKADQDLRGTYAMANANMNAAYNQANASINAARTAASRQADEFNWYLDRAIEANGGNQIAGLRDYYQYINNKYSGQNNITGLLNNMKN